MQLSGTRRHAVRDATAGDQCQPHPGVDRGHQRTRDDAGHDVRVLPGEYKATSFVATALSATSRVKVTDIDAEFRNGQYTFDFDDDHPVNLTVGKSTQKVRIDGEIRGSYSGDADALTFTRGSTSGTAKIKQNGATRSFPMREVAEILAPQGKGSAVCNGNELTLKADGLTWQMVRDGD